MITFALMLLMQTKQIAKVVCGLQYHKSTIGVTVGCSRNSDDSVGTNAPAYLVPTSTILDSLLFVSGGNVEFTLAARHLDDPDSPKNATLSFDQPGSGRIDRISDSEYQRLQAARKALSDAETEIAKAHGVRFLVAFHPCTKWSDTFRAGEAYCETKDYVAQKLGDIYEFRGQFLLVNVPKSEDPR